MKKTKVLVPALGILCLSMAASITGTVAWFSANASVTANGMRIAAATDSSLLISDEMSHTFGYTMSFTALTNPTVMPVSPIVYQGPHAGDATGHVAGSVTGVTDKTVTNVHHIEMYQKGGQNAVPDVALYGASYSFASFAAGDLSNAGATTFVAEGAYAVATSNYATDDMYLRLDAVKDSTKAINMTITVTSAAEGGKAIDKALHIGLHVQRDQSLGLDYPTDIGGQIAVDETTADDDTFRNYDLSSFKQPGVGEGKSGAADKYAQTYANWLTLTAHKAVKVTAYAWYEGEDADCTSNNANIVNELTIDFAFGLAE